MMGEEGEAGEERAWRSMEDVMRRRDGWGIIPKTGAVLHSLGRGTLSLFNWIWLSCCLSAYESPNAPSQLSKPS